MNNGESVKNLLLIIGYIYITIGQIMALYFWWQYAQHHGFWSSILIGPIVGILKGLFWIFYI